MIGTKKLRRLWNGTKFFKNNVIGSKKESLINDKNRP